MKKHEYIWVTLYGGSPNKKTNQLIQIKISDCKYCDDWYGKGPTYCYIWSWPGPDYNLYHWRDFGKTWAYELEQFNLPDIEEYTYKPKESSL